MSTRDLIIYLSMCALAAVGVGYGWRFLRLKNPMLGCEWFVLGGNSFNGLLVTSGLVPALRPVWDYFDVFSKIVGVTVIGALGLMRVTHGLHLSGRTEVAIWIVGLLLSLAFMLLDALRPLLPWVALGMGLGFMGLLIDLARRAFAGGLTGHGWLMLLVIVLNLGIAVLQDFATLPGDATALFFNRLVLEHLVWACSFAALYHVYVALGGPAAAAPAHANRPSVAASLPA